MIGRFPGDVFSLPWLLWVASGVAFVLSFALIAWHYHRRKTRPSTAMAILWASLITLPGLLFAAGTLWWIIEWLTIRID